MLTKFDIDLSSNIDFYSAYVYRITVTFLDGTWKIYIGAHKGTIYDSYIFSSESKEFLKDLRNRNNKVYFEIVKKGTTYDMFDLENQMLEEVNAKDPNNKEYYNNTNGGSRYTEQSAKVEAFIDSIIEKCNQAEELNEDGVAIGAYKDYIKYLTTEEIESNRNKYDAVQIRTEKEEVADMEYCKPIADQIDLIHKGDTSFLPPCLALGGLGPNKDGFLWVDGTQRFTSVSISELGKTVKVIVLPKSEYKLIAGKVGEITEAMIDLAYLRNPLEPSPLPMKPKELSRRIFDRCSKLEHITSDVSRRFLSKQNRVGKSAEKIIQGAVDIWNNDEAAKKRGKDFHFYAFDSPEGKEILSKKKTKIEEDFPDDIIWGPYSSSTFGPDHIFGVIQQKMFPSHKNKYPTMIIGDLMGRVIRPVIYHSTDKDQKEWEAGKAVAVRQLLEDLGGKFNLKIAPYSYSDLIAKKVTSKATK